MDGREAGVVAFVAIERPPRDSSWVELCASAGVSLVWPATVVEALRKVEGTVD